MKKPKPGQIKVEMWFEYRDAEGQILSTVTVPDDMVHLYVPPDVRHLFTEEEKTKNGIE